jgi:pSer/pThr/pTyr-binding forkhead associated (FHA) protein
MYVGRELDNDIQVNDPRISRRHARIRADGTRVTVADLGSTNGTLVNDVPITGEYELHDGDLVRMGHSEWAFHSVYSAEPAARSASRRPVADERAYAPRPARTARTSSRDIVDNDELPWGAIAIVVGGLIIGFSICCIAAVFILSR